MTLDFYFKSVYGSEDPRVKEGMKKFLSNVIKKEIIDYDILNPELLGITRDSKTQVVDLHLKTKAGEKILVEMQINSQDEHFLPRIFHAGQRLYSNQLKKGDEYSSMKSVYVIAFIDKESDKNLYEHIENIFVSKDKRINKSVDYHLFYLKNVFRHSKINVNSYDEQFLRLLKEPFSEEIRDETLINFVEVISEMGMDKESFEKMIEECNEIYMNSIKGSARRKGLAEGRAEGRAEGLEEGINQGRMDEKRQTIQKLLNFGMKKDDILKSLELDEEDYNFILSQN